MLELRPTDRTEHHNLLELNQLVPLKHQPDGKRMSSEFAELLSTWYTEEELQERYREYADFKANLAGRKEGLEEGCRKVAAKLIQSGMSLDEVSQITELPLETLKSL